ncbi:10949_t:CDS:2 [Gigaspora margarita]|uniref:10949_t:CDS:1 n=1 Tax=Gigaspora margarita TaxID=4874 RepID=A0ABN7V6C1_GIGMA|nr:10949_t:CDS:2 [Gigaspora margarita]
MVKSKICDWRSLDDNPIQIRVATVATLKRLLPTAITFGVKIKLLNIYWYAVN